MGRSPCCVNNGLKKGPWTVEEDKKLVDYIQKHGQGNWRTLPKNAGLNRCGKSCRLRWTNYLRPDIKRGQFTFEEEEAIIQLHRFLGNKWSAIAAQFAGRTDNEIKNYWNTHIKKRLLKMGIDPVTHTPCLNFLDLSSVFASSLHTHYYSQYINIPKSLNMNSYTLNPDLLDLATTLSPSNFKGAQMPQNVQETIPQAQDQFQYSLLANQLHNPPNNSHFLNEKRLMHENNVREISPSNPNDFVSCNGNSIPSYWHADGQIHHQHMNLAKTSVSVPNLGYDGSCHVVIDPFFCGHHVFQSNDINRVHNYDLGSSSLLLPTSSLEMSESVQETNPQVQDQLQCSLLANQLHKPPSDFHFLNENRLMHASDATEISPSNPNDFVSCNGNFIPGYWQADGQTHRQYMNIDETSVSALNHEIDSCRFVIDHFVSGHHVFQSNDTSKGQNWGLGSSSLSSAMSSPLALNAPSTPFLGSCDGEDRDGPGSHIVSFLYDAAPSSSFVNGIM